MSVELNVRDSFATLNGDATIVKMPSGGLEIVTQDNRALFNVYLREDGSIEIKTSASVVKHNGVLWGSGICVHPLATNAVVIRRAPYA